MRIEVIHNSDRRIAVLVLEGETSAKTILTAACNKLRLKAKKCRLFRHGIQLQPEFILHDGCTVWLVGEKDTYSGRTSEACQSLEAAKSSVNILDGAEVWIDPKAVEQV